MKNYLWAGFIISACLVAPVATLAGLAISDNAGNYTSWGNSSSTSSSQSPGTGTIGISGWTFGNTVANGSLNGSFLGGSGAQQFQTLNINSGSGNAWGLYGNSGDQALATATFNNPLTAGQVLTVEMQNDDVVNGGTVGLNLKSSGGNTLFTFQFTGGGGRLTTM